MLSSELHLSHRATLRAFLRLVAFCFLMAFVSIYPQIQGLYGPGGILPVEQSLKKDPATAMFSTEALLNLDPVGFVASIKGRAVQQFSSELGLEPDLAMEAVALAGAFAAGLATIFPRFLNKPTFFVMWYLYLSLFNHGQTFLWFQWDTLLLEVGLLCVVAAPLLLCYGDPGHHSPWDAVSLGLVRWLLFRMMFSSGVVKLTGGDGAWWGLTAMPTHYESQCLPTQLSWFAYNLTPGGEWSHKLSVVITYVIEIPLTFLFFAPTAALKQLTFAAQLALMLLIMATGNYNFFNILFGALCLSLADDRWWLGGGSGTEKPRFGEGLLRFLVFAFNACAVAALCYFTAILCFDWDALEPKLMFSQSSFNHFVAQSSLWGVYAGAALLSTTVVVALYKSVAYSTGFFQRVRKLLVTSLYAAAAAALFGVSVPTFLRGLGQPVPADVPPVVFREWADRTHHLQVTHSYGLFRSMTGVGGRPEVVIEGALRESGPWKEYHFTYKPGELDAPPIFCLPHQPRLDWQMWFAALGSYQHNPWLLNLAYRLLQNESAVLGLLDKGRLPFPERPPKYIRARLYTYHFTDEFRTKDWWWRELKQQYLPPVSLDNADLSAYAAQAGLEATDKKRKRKSKSPNSIAVVLQAIRGAVATVTHHGLVWSFAAVAAVAAYTN